MTFTHILAPSIACVARQIVGKTIDLLTRTGFGVLHIDFGDQETYQYTFDHEAINRIIQATQVRCDIHQLMPRVAAGASIRLRKQDTLILRLDAHDAWADQLKLGKRIYGLGVSVNVDEDLDRLCKLLPHLRTVVLMGGPLGQRRAPLDGTVFKKCVLLAELRAKHRLKFEIQIDGGVNESTIVKLLQYPFDRIVVASLLFGSDDVFSRSPATQLVDRLAILEERFFDDSAEKSNSLGPLCP